MRNQQGKKLILMLIIVAIVVIGLFMIRETNNAIIHFATEKMLTTNHQASSSNKNISNLIGISALLYVLLSISTASIGTIVAILVRYIKKLSLKLIFS